MASSFSRSVLTAEPKFGIRSVAEPARIQDIQERVRDFTGALRRAGASDLAEQFERHALDFSDEGRVRRSVAAIQQQLQYFRDHPEALPDMPIVQVAANRLEDLCRAALVKGRIDPAQLSLRATGMRKLRVIVGTLCAAAVASVIPLALTRYGVDWNDLQHARSLPPIRLAQGREQRVEVNALARPERPETVSGVRFLPAGRCAGELEQGLRCRATDPQDWPEHTGPSYEVMLEHQAYGLMLGFQAGELVAGVGRGVVIALATPETPEGRYSVPLEAAFIGYAPERCSLLSRIQGRCEPLRVGPGQEHDGVPGPTLVVDVVRGNPDRARIEREADARAEAERARVRAEKLSENLALIAAALDETRALQRKQQWERARQRLDKLAELFSPLDALVVRGGGDDVLPAELSSMRARFEAQSKQQGEFEQRAFDVLYAESRRATDGPGVGDDARRAAVAEKLRISPDYLDSIYAAHADQLEARLAAVEAERRDAREAKQDALVRRCGALPTRAFAEVKAYLEQLGPSAGVRCELKECMTPRLSEEQCWSSLCSFVEIVSGDLGDRRTPHTWTFLFKHGRVTAHVSRVVH